MNYAWNARVAQGPEAFALRHFQSYISRTVDSERRSGVADGLPQPESRIPYLHNSIKDKVLEATDIVDVVGERVSLTRKGKEFIGLCPFHNDRNPSMNVSPAKQIFKCWACGTGGDALKFVQLDRRVDFREALRILAERAHIPLSGSSGEDERQRAARDGLRRTLEWAAQYFARNLREHPAGPAAQTYAAQRGLTQPTIERFGMGLALDDWDELVRAAARVRVDAELLLQAGLCGRNQSGKLYDRFRHRLVFPIHDGQGRCVAFGGRTLADDPAKYLNSPETPLFSKSRVLYALHAAKDAIQKTRQAVIVEGYLDAVLLHQHGVDNVVATLGTALTDSHVKLLRPLADELIMCFDSDEAGVRAADRAVEVALKHRLDVKVCLLPDGQDPADVVVSRGGSEFKSLLPSALGALEFKWDRTFRAYKDQGPRGRRDAAGAFLQFIAQTSVAGGFDPIEQGLLVSRVSDLLQVPSGDVYDWLKRHKPSASRPGSEVLSTDDASEYDSAVRGIPVGLVSAVEEVFGLALAAPERWDRMDSSLAAASRHCPAWRRLYELIGTVRESSSSWSRSDVLARCHDATLLELVGRAAQRVSDSSVNDESAEAVCGRVAHELEALRFEALDESVRNGNRAPEDQDRAFRSLLEVAKRHESALGVRQRRAPVG